MRDSGGLRSKSSALCPLSKPPLFCVRLSLHELMRTTAGCGCGPYLKHGKIHGKIFGCQIKFGFKILWLNYLIYTTIGVYSDVFVFVEVRRRVSVGH